MNTVIAATLPGSQPQRDEDKPFFEIIDGQRVALPPRSILASRVASKLHGLLGIYLCSNPLGEVLMAMLYHLPLPGNRNRRPTVAFVSTQTIADAPAQLGSENAWGVLPELMVEVVSPNDLAEEIMERVVEYFTAGTKIVWVVYPTHRLVYVYESQRQVRILGDTDDLDGGTLLPGFRLPLASLFPR